MDSRGETAKSLKADLDAFRADFMAKVPAEIREAMARADMELGCFRRRTARIESRWSGAGFPLARRVWRLRKAQ